MSERCDVFDNSCQITVGVAEGAIVRWMVVIIENFENVVKTEQRPGVQLI